MNGNQNGDGFRYSYSAKEQEELRRIREKYTGKEENKLERLRRLDNSVTQKAQAAALVFGIIGALLLGFGMSLFMTELGDALSLSKTAAMVVGILLGILGGVLASLAYPTYNFVCRKERAKIAPEIIRLTDELMK